MLSVPQLFDNMLMDLAKNGKKPKCFVLSTAVVGQVTKELKGERKYRGVPVNFTTKMGRSEVYLIPIEENEKNWRGDENENL